ncbi:MAG: acyltransferase [Microthrixaceae bacterium]
MTAPTHPRADRTAAPAVRAGRDRFLDTVKAVAVIRVVLWHTWSWWWLSWVPAMPAMFFASGALLEDSLVRRGWWPTVRQRFRRLIIPFWAYSATSVAVMLVLGWRPAPGDLLGWFVPLVDPVGDPGLPGLWIPLWYVRAYLWFVIGSWVLSRAVRRLGSVAVLASVAATVVAWWWTRTGGSVPAEVGDALAYSGFVMAGMAYRTRGAPRRRGVLVFGLAAGAAAMWWWASFGPSDGVVNRSYPLTVLVGAAGLGLALAYRDRLAGLDGRIARLVDLIGRRALTIYLWQGLGLVAAQRLVDTRWGPGPLRAVAALAVVVAVIVAAVALVGPLEDRAAGRAPRRRPDRRLVLPGAALVVVALLLPPAERARGGSPVGQGGGDRAEQIQRSPAGAVRFHQRRLLGAARPPARPPARRSALGEASPRWGQGRSRRHGRSGRHRLPVTVPPLMGRGQACGGDAGGGRQDGQTWPGGR